MCALSIYMCIYDKKVFYLVEINSDKSSLTAAVATVICQERKCFITSNGLTDVFMCVFFWWMGCCCWWCHWPLPACAIKRVNLPHPWFINKKKKIGMEMQFRFYDVTWRQFFSKLFVAVNNRRSCAWIMNQMFRKWNRNFIRSWRDK